MSGFIEGADRHQTTLFPGCLDDYVAEESAVRVIDVLVDELDLSGLGFRAEANETDRPGYHPATMLKRYIYGYRTGFSRAAAWNGRRSGTWR